MAHRLKKVFGQSCKKVGDVVIKAQEPIETAGRSSACGKAFVSRANSGKLEEFVCSMTEHGEGLTCVCKRQRSDGAFNAFAWRAILRLHEPTH